MQKPCSSCGAEIVPGARFCRRCGGLVHVAGDGTGNVSPQAATIPLNAEESRTTDGLAPGEESVSANTSRVSRAEMERLLRMGQEIDGQKPFDPNATIASLNGDTLTRDSEATLIANPVATVPVTSDALDSSDLEEELTVTVPRPARSLQTRETSSEIDASDAATSQYVTRETTTFDQTDAAPHESAPSQEDYQHTETTDGAQASFQQQHAPSPQAAVAKRPRRRWPFVVAAVSVVLVLAVAVTLLAVKFLRRPSLAELPVQTPTAPATTSATQFDEKLSEAESLLAQGNMDEAVARLREANALDPSNTRAHRRLGELLLASGARRDAIEEFRAVTRNAPDDFTAWRELATAQFAEGLYRDAADSYRRLISLVGEQSAEGGDLLSYADALRLSGRADEARAIYQRLVASSSEEVAGPARQRLAELAQSSPVEHPVEQAGTQTPREGETASLTQPNTQPTPAPTPTPAPQSTPTPARAAVSSPAEHYQRGVELWSPNRASSLAEFRAAAAGGNLDAHYYLGLSYVEGRDIHKLQRAEIVAALQHFQVAERGQFAAQSRSYTQQLEKEFDRLRKQ